jgi:hypothetical protein
MTYNQTQEKGLESLLNALDMAIAMPTCGYFESLIEQVESENETGV